MAFQTSKKLRTADKWAQKRAKKIIFETTRLNNKDLLLPHIEEGSLHLLSVLKQHH